jgi:serine/threonine-protein kinase
VGNADAMLLQPGQVLVEKYRVTRLLGRGGMAEVYAAHHELLQQTVAIKILLPEVASSPGATTRFLNEARAAARIRGENIAAVMDVGTLPTGAAYMVLEYLEGQDLEAHAEQRGALPAAEAVEYVLQALQALAQAHALGIVHRDIKPSNLYLARYPDGSSIVKVLDFGISKSSQALGLLDGNSTSTRAMMGSPYYMAPEQARSAKAVDQRADVWAIGVVLYRLLAGRVPFHGETLAELILVIAQDEPPPLREFRPDLPASSR